MNRFQLLKNIHIIEQGLSEEFIKILEKCKNPHIICFYGNEKVDKKIKIINQIINGNTNQYHLTNNQSNCCFYGPIKIKDIIKNNDLNINNIQININDDIIFIDSHDLKNIENFGNTYITEILTILQISSLNILYINYNNINDFDSEISNMKLINILNPNENKKIIILFGDVLLTELNQRQILGEIKQYKKIFQEKINPFMSKEGNIGGICEILPLYETNNQLYYNSYKSQIKVLIQEILENIEYHNINSKQIVKEAKGYLDIFRYIIDINNIKKGNIKMNKILLELYKEKIRLVYSELTDKINRLDKDVPELSKDKEVLQNYVLNKVKSKLENIWNLLNIEDIKKEIKNSIWNLEEKLGIVVDKKNIQNEKDFLDILNIKKNQNIIEYLHKYKYREQYTQNEINDIINKVINSLSENQFNLDKNKILELKEYLTIIVNNAIKSKKEWKKYLETEIKEIKEKVSNPFIHQTISNGNSDIKANLTNNLQSLKYKIDLYIAQKNIEIYDKNIFINEINKIYLEAYEQLNEKITPIKNGIYEIEACHCGKVFDVYGAFMEDNVRIQIYDKVSVLNQRFEVIYEPKYDGYIIKALHSNKYLSVSVNPNDINVQQQTIKNDRSNQLWNITKTNTNNYKLQSKYNGKFIDINSAGSDNGTQVITWEKNNGLWQEFRFNPIDIFPQENKKELTNHETRQGNLEYFNENRPIQNGIYLIEACHCSNKVLDVYGAFQEENALIQLYDKNGGANQRFEVIYDYKKKGYTLKALHSNKYVSIIYNDTNIRQQSIKYDFYDRSNILWNIIKTERNNYKIQTQYNERFISIKDAGTVNGTNIITMHWFNELYQEFRFTPI